MIFLFTILLASNSNAFLCDLFGCEQKIIVLPFDINATDILDFNIIDPQNNQLLVYSDLNKQWENRDANKVPDVNNADWFDGKDSTEFIQANGSIPFTANWYAGPFLASFTDINTQIIINSNYISTSNIINSSFISLKPSGDGTNYIRFSTDGSGNSVIINSTNKPIDVSGTLRVVNGGNFDINPKGGDDGKFSYYTIDQDLCVRMDAEDFSLEVIEPCKLILGTTEYAMYYNDDEGVAIMDGRGLTGSGDTDLWFIKDVYFWDDVAINVTGGSTDTFTVGKTGVEPKLFKVDTANGIVNITEDLNTGGDLNVHNRAFFDQNVTFKGDTTPRGVLWDTVRGQLDVTGFQGLGGVQYALGVKGRTRLTRTGDIVNSPYTLSVQSNRPSTYMEILNDAGVNTGVFFGVENRGGVDGLGDSFTQYNWQGGPFEFFTAETLSAGTVALTIENDGDVIIEKGDLNATENAKVDGTLFAGNIDTDGNLSFSGAFVELFQNEIPTTVPVSDINVFVPVSGFTTGKVKSFKTNDTNVTPLIAGHYLANWSISFNDGTNNEYNGGIMVNGTALNSGRAHRKLGTGTDIGNFGATAIVNLNIDDNVSLAMSNESATTDAFVQHANMTLTYIGK